MFSISKMNFSVLSYLSNFSMSTIILLVLLQILTIVIISHQWYALAREFNKGISFLKIIELVVIGTFTESITPAVKSGGEGVKLLLLKRDFSLMYNEGLSIIIVQKTISSLVFMFYFCISVTQTKFKVDVQLFHCMYVMLAVIALMLSYFFFAPKNVKNKVSVFITKVVTDLASFKNKKMLLGYLTLNNLIVWLGYPIKLFIITRVFNVELNIIQLSAVIFITYGVSMLPTTPGSIGTYEGTMTLLFRFVGVPTNKALAIAIVTRFFTFWLVVILSGLYIGTLKLMCKGKAQYQRKTL